MDLSAPVIFGGAGFIGTHLAEHLVSLGAAVTVVDIGMPTRPVPGVAYVLGDVREPIAWEDRPDPSIVFNLAAVHREPGHAEEEYFATNVAGAKHVTKFCIDRQCTDIVFASSISVYGPTEDPLDESAAPQPVSAYGKSKLEAETIHRAWLDSDARHRLVVVRPAVVFGPGENGNFTRLAAALRRRRFVYPGRRDTIKSCGYVKDLVETMLFALERGEREITYNFAYGERHTVEDICTAFHAEGLPKPLGMVPLRPMLAAARASEALGAPAGINRARVMKLVRSTNIRPTWLEGAGYRPRYDLASALADWRTESDFQ